MPEASHQRVPAPAWSDDNRRRNVRLRSKSRVVVIRDTDAMRNGLPGALLDVSCEGLGFVIDAPLEAGEQIKIRVRNDIQRFEKEIRGVVRRVSEDDDGSYQIGVELRCRLTPLDVSMLRSGLIGSETAWV
jgi:PilZ domain